jgi:hypothetical protein
VFVRGSLEILAVDVFFADGRDFDVDDAVFIVYGPSKAAEAEHVDACVDNREKAKLGEQQESRNDVVRDQGIHSDAELSQRTLEGYKEENTVLGGMVD